jgi:hypothetical protein
MTADPELPPLSLVAYYRRIEPNAEVAAVKAHAARSLSLKARSILQQRDLAVCLHAIGRDAEALAVIDWPMRSVVYRGRTDAWYAASTCWAVGARIRRRRGEVTLVRDGLERFVEHPSHDLLLQPMNWDTARLEAASDEERQRFGEASSEDDASAMARAVGELLFLRETAIEPFPHAHLRLGWLDSSIAELLGGLRLRVEGVAPAP